MVSRRDFDRLASHVDAIDRDGSRGVAVLQTQMTELVKDIAELKGQSGTWQETHERQHQADARDRITGRRWMITTGIAGAVAMTAAIGLLIDIAAHLH